MVKFCRKRSEQVFIGRNLAGKTHRQHGSAVEAAIESDNAATTGMCTCNFDRVLDCLGTRGNKNSLFLR